MRASPRVRLLMLVLVFIPALLALATYIATRDWAHLARQYQMGHKPDWPPGAQGRSKPAIVDTATHTAVGVLHLPAVAAARALVLAATAPARRALHRRRRARTTI